MRGGGKSLHYTGSIPGEQGNRDVQAMTGTFRVGLVQMCTGRDVDKNVADAGAIIRAGGPQGAPVRADARDHHPDGDSIAQRLFAAVRPEEGNAAIAHFRALARELGIWLHIGSMAILVGNGKLANRSFLISPAGEITARYDKIHMFDVASRRRRELSRKRELSARRSRRARRAAVGARLG